MPPPTRSTPSIPRALRVGAALLAAAGPVPGAVSAPVNPAGFVIHRGTNLSHWLSQDFGWAPRSAFITENDLRFIRAAGFDHVRIPVDEVVLWHEDGAPDVAALACLQRAIGWCRDLGLRVIVDLHTLRSHHFIATLSGGTNPLWTEPAAQDHFLDLWDHLSQQLHHHPVTLLAYEILNEPVADDDEDWNRLVAAATKRLRAREPDRVLVIGANRWQNPGRLPALRIPPGDRNLILSIHTYAPLLFTHHHAGWLPLKSYTGAVRYPGPVVPAAELTTLLDTGDPAMRPLIADASDQWDAARLTRELEPAVRRARELGLQLYCGEFGCLPTVPRADRLAYYRDLRRVFDAQGIAWANWEYKGDFGVFEWHGPETLTGAPDVELLDALLPPEKKTPGTWSREKLSCP
jgi:endoglucanase